MSVFDREILMVQSIINTKLIMEDGIIWDGAITFENGKIIEAGWLDDVYIPASAERFDAKGLYTAPGLIDIHNHGGGKKLFVYDPIYCIKHFIVHGETTILPTFYSNISCEDMLSGGDLIRKVSKKGIGKVIAYGLYMEGPYMSGSGSFQNSMKWDGLIDASEYKPLVDGLKDLVRIWAIDPARNNIREFMKYAAEANNNVIFALGHSEATSEQVRKLEDFNIRDQTHHGDSGKAKGSAQGTIGAGCDEYTLYHPDIYAELICDVNGIHVQPDLIKLIVKMKGVEKVILITDSMIATEYLNSKDEGILYGPDLNYDDQGHLAGSKMTLECGCRNLMKHSGYGLCHAIRMATYNPAKLLGLDGEIGCLKPNRKANFIIIDDMVNVKSVFLEGVHVVEKGELLTS